MYVCVVTRNRSIAATTLHSLMNMHMLAYTKNIHLDIHFVQDLTCLPKLFKTGERIIWFDYGTNVDQDHIPALIQPFEHGVRVLVCPAVKEGIDWDMFKKKTLANSKEPDHQRGLHFDTDVSKKLADGLYEVKKTSARVWAVDSKPIDKKLRGEKIQVKLDTSSYETMFAQLQTLGIRIAALTNAQVICHYQHRCEGNILETSGVKLTP
jgi:hypothetical protein